MAKGIYIGADNIARKVKGMYVGVDGVARKVVKGYVGVDGVARLFYIAQTALGDLAVGDIFTLNEEGTDY